MTHECDMCGDNNTALRIEHECPYTGEVSLICFLCYIPRSIGGDDSTGFPPACGTMDGPTWDELPEVEG